MKTQCAATVFSVTNLDASLKFYVDVLGFTEDFRFGEYAGIKHGNVSIHLSQNHTDMRPPGSGAVYIFCDEVDDFYQEITAKGVKTTSEPKDYAYGMRDFLSYDPDGNQVSFGTESRKSH
jgi:uncharacterized glyoxalase superfamily protein PhnB